MSANSQKPKASGDDELAHQSDDERAIEFARASLARARASARRSGRSAFRGRTRWVSPADTVEPIFSGPGPDDRDPSLISAVAASIVHQRGWDTKINLAAVVGRWAHIVGPDISAHAQVETFEVTAAQADGSGASVILVVRADSSAWATQLRVLAATLTRRIVEELPPGAQVDMRILGPAAPTWRHGSRHVPGRGPRDTYG